MDPQARTTTEPANRPAYLHRGQDGFDFADSCGDFEVAITDTTVRVGAKLRRNTTAQLA